MSEDAARPLPTTVEAITPAWLTTALRIRAPGATVRDARVVDMIRGTCTLIRLRLDLDEAGRRAGIPETVMLKGGFEPHSREWSRMHMKEALAYRDVLPVLGLNVPACHFADYDAEARQGIVIMDDLAARGVTFCHALRPHGFDQVRRRLSMLAAFHAKTWSPAEALRQGRWGWLRDHALDSQDYISRFLTPEVWSRFMASPRAAAVSVRFHDRAWLAEVHRKMADYAQRLPHSVLHADTHLGNLYVEADGTPGFYDPISVRGPAMMEISYHVCCALDVADRRRWEGALLQHYLDELARNGVDPPGFDEAMDQYALFLARGVGVFLFNEAIFQEEAFNTAYANRFGAAMIDHDTVARLEAIA
jgi:hypothetical protein